LNIRTVRLYAGRSIFISCYIAAAHAQDATAVQQNIETTELAAAPVQPYLPLTPAEKLLYSVHQVFGPSHLFGYTVQAAAEQITDRPAGWGTKPDAYAIRMASIIGRNLVRESLAFGVRAADHEDPRYFVCGQGSTWHRTRYALAHAFVSRTDSGGTIPAYSRFIADYTTPFIADQWRPERFHTGQAFRAGTAAFGFAMVSNVLQEFLPDLKRKILQHTNSERLAHFLKN